jgi:hypothetical protein
MAVDHTHLFTLKKKPSNAPLLLQQQLVKLYLLQTHIKKQQTTLSNQLLDRIHLSLELPNSAEHTKVISLTQQNLLLNIQKQNFLTQVISQVIRKIENTQLHSTTTTNTGYALE